MIKKQGVCPAFFVLSCGVVVLFAYNYNAVRLPLCTSHLPVPAECFINGIKGAIMAFINVVIPCNISYPPLRRSVNHVLSILYRFITFRFAIFPNYTHIHQPFIILIGIYDGGDINTTQPSYIPTLKRKPVIVCGDLNVAATELDLKNPQANRNNAGFSIQERAKFAELLKTGFVDTYRHLHPDEIKYSWWSYRFNARAKNAGWRIDYFLISDFAKSLVLNADILTDVQGSDHAPVLLEVNI